MPNRPYRVDDESCRQISGGRDHRFPGLATTLAGNDLSAIVENGRPSRPMNGAIDTATTQQGRIGRIDDRIDGYFSDVSLHDLYPGSYLHRMFGVKMGRYECPTAIRQEKFLFLFLFLFNSLK